MRVYLCGLPQMREPSRAEAYAAAAAELAQCGHDAVSPYTTGLEDESLSTDDALAADVSAFARAEAVVMLGDPVECYETVTARFAGKPVLRFASLLARAS